MPPAPVTPEEKTQRRLIGAIVTLSVLTLIAIVVGFGWGAKTFALKRNVRPTAVDVHALPGPSLEIFDQIYNLAGTSRYMKATLQLELDTRHQDEASMAEFWKEVRLRKPQIEDLLISEMSGKTFRSVSTPEGKEQLKEELRLKINSLLSYGELKEVLFTNFAVQ